MGNLNIEHLVESSALALVSADAVLAAVQAVPSVNGAPSTMPYVMAKAETQAEHIKGTGVQRVLLTLALFIQADKSDPKNDPLNLTTTANCELYWGALQGLVYDANFASMLSAYPKLKCYGVVRGAQDRNVQGRHWVCTIGVILHCAQLP